MTSRRLFVSGIANNVGEDVIRMYFSRFGFMSEFVLPLESETGMNRGFAYITYSDQTSTSKCLEESCHKIKGRDVTVTSLEEEGNLMRMPALKSKKLFVSFLGIEGITENALRQAFSSFGAISSVHFARDDDEKLLFYAIITFESEESVDMCLKVNHCINGRSVVVRKAVRKEQVKLAEQSERERAHLEEHQKHGYAGYGRAYVTVTSLGPQSTSVNGTAAGYPASYVSQCPPQNDPAQEQYLREYEQYQQQMVEYQKQLAEYHVKLNKYHDEMQQYQMQRQYKNALDQAAFQNAYNYTVPSQGVSSEATGSDAGTDISERMKNYGYLGSQPP
ncbi:hypothetical protein Y032_0208g2066 [Ancylostoma ceylanicum]|uniref:RRM domain-containing protein n=3 Tax=Ancylostoma ceylanicum TaxID=53326 RepID=A0A016SLN3_9BILA|nr:hypothetical protein Y032_0208g2066 [Ancylostoma ceylanicum]